MEVGKFAIDTTMFTSTTDCYVAVSCSSSQARSTRSMPQPSPPLTPPTNRPVCCGRQINSPRNLVTVSTVTPLMTVRVLLVTLW